jgi:segregation and condensation protein B
MSRKKPADNHGSSEMPQTKEVEVPEEVAVAQEAEITNEMEPEFEVTGLSLSGDVASVVLEPDEEADVNVTATQAEIRPVIEALLFVAEEPLPFRQLCKIMGDVAEQDVRSALTELVDDYETRNSGLEIREIAGGWRISTRPQYHEFIRKYLRTRPGARLSIAALETLAVIAYKQPVTIPEILEIRGVSSSSAIRTLLEKRLITTKGRKETVGRPMLYGTSKEFLLQFGLKDLSELPGMEDLEDINNQ